MDSVFQFLLECPSVGFMTLAHKLTSKPKAMKTFVKNYIGKGKKVDGIDIIKMSFKLADLVKFAHQYKDEDYVTIEIARLKSTDQFGHDYTAYVNRLEEKEEPKQESPKKSRKSKKAETVPASKDDIPF